MFKSMIIRWKAAFILVAFFSVTATGQPSFGIMDFSSTFNNEYWNQDVAYQMRDLLVSGLQPIGSIQPMTREHVLLLLKELEPPDLDNLDEKVIVEIGRRQGLQYLVKGTLQKLEVKDKLVTFKIRLVIYKTNDATIIWDKAPEVSHELTDKELKEHILLKGGIYKPTLLGMVDEIKKLPWK
jgi:hypothetical protein